MEYLLDTCVILNAVSNDGLIPQKIKDVINDEDNDIFFSNASLWEIEIKHLRNPTLMPLSSTNIANELITTKVRELPIRVEYINELKNITCQGIHKDPFDHLLLAMAKFEGMILITSDTNFLKYQGVKVLKY